MENAQIQQDLHYCSFHYPNTPSMFEMTFLSNQSNRGIQAFRLALALNDRIPFELYMTRSRNIIGIGPVKTRGILISNKIAIGTRTNVTRLCCNPNNEKNNLREYLN